MMYRTLLKCPKSTPDVAMTWDLGGFQMKNRIMQKKLIFMNHILHLDSKSLAKEIQIIQNTLNLPSLTKECKEYIRELDLPNIFEEKIKKGRL